MRKLLLLTAVGLLLCATGSFVGCSDDDEDNGLLEPTAADTAKVELFMSQFADRDEANGQMLNFTIHVIDSVMNAAASSKAPRVTGAAEAAEIHVTLDWHAASQYWYCTAVDTTDDGTTVFNYMDSVQFRHSGTPVQWPVDSLLTEVRSYLRMHVSGEGVDTASAWQNTVLSVLTASSDTLHVSGTGGFYAEFTETDIDYNDTTICSMMFDLGYTYSNLQFDQTGEGSDLGCPFDGTLAATGSVDIACTGAESGSVTGTWTVTEDFDNGVVHITVQHGGFTFKGDESCD